MKDIILKVVIIALLIIILYFIFDSKVRVKGVFDKIEEFNKGLITINDSLIVINNDLNDLKNKLKEVDEEMKDINGRTIGLLESISKIDKKIVDIRTGLKKEFSSALAEIGFVPMKPNNNSSAPTSPGNLITGGKQ